jgi:Mn-dependent DtxR family transcriptional regulator
MDNLNKSILVALFDLAQLDRAASVSAVAERLGQGRREVAEGLSQLDRLGLIRAETCRLTLRGLARAASLRSRRSHTLAA